MAYFVKASAKVYRKPIQSKCFKDYFSKNLKINQNLNTNQSKHPPKHLFQTLESNKNKKSSIKAQNKKQLLKHKIENKGNFNFSQKLQIPTIEQNYILMPPKLAHPALK